jgi:hypothetical protein
MALISCQCFGGWRISLFWRGEAKKFKRKKTPKQNFSLAKVTKTYQRLVNIIAIYHFSISVKSHLGLYKQQVNQMQG